MDWYKYVAKRNGGYKINVSYEVVGESAEDVIDVREAGGLAL